MARSSLYLRTFSVGLPPNAMLFGSVAKRLFQTCHFAITTLYSKSVYFYFALSVYNGIFNNAYRAFMIPSSNKIQYFQVNLLYDLPFSVKKSNA